MLSCKGTDLWVGFSRPADANGDEQVLRFWIPSSGPDKKERKPG